MLRCYITDRHALGGDLAELRRLIARAAQQGVDYVQLREKDLSAAQLLELAEQARKILEGSPTKLLINDRADVAFAAGAHGVHLRSEGIRPEVIRRIAGPDFLIGVSCHSLEDVREAQAADFLVFGPVFPTPGKGPALGLPSLRQAAAASAVPVLALGGVEESNLDQCLEAGAAGYAAIRAFQRLR